MPGFLSRLVDSLPRDSKNLVWRAPLVFVAVIFFLSVFFPYRDTPYAIEVVRDTFGPDGKIDPSLRHVVSRRITSYPAWATSFLHYREERELSVSEVSGESNQRTQERTIEVVSRGLNLGLDLRGGTELLYRIVQVGTHQAASADEIKSIIEKRINIHGLREPRIQAQGANRILVQLPGQEMAELERLKKIIQNIGHLEFRILANKESEAYRSWMQTGVAPPGYTEYTIKAHAGEPGSHDEKVLVSDKSEMTGTEIVSTRVNPPGAGGSLRGYSVSLSFSPRGEQEFARVTGDHVGDRLAIILNTARDAQENIVKDQKGTCDSAPVIRTRIFGDAIIEGDFSDKAAADLRTVLMAGSLPAPLELEHENTVGPGLGSALITKGIRASVIGTLLVLTFMAVYYLGAGLIADFAVTLNIIILVAIMILFKSTLTLPGIAGLALTVGMAVDANVLIYERIREELHGTTEKPLRLAVREGFARAFVTIFDSNLTTIITAVILYWIGTGSIKGFGLTLTIGLIINLFTAVTVTRVIFDILIWRRWITRIPMLQFFKRTSIPFMKIRFPAMAVSAVLIVAGMVVFFARGSNNWDIDFKGGTMLHVALRQEMDAEDLTRRLHAAGPEFADAEVQSLISATQGAGAFAGRRSREFEIRIPSLSEATITEVTTDPSVPPSTREASFSLRSPIAPDELAQKVKGYTFKATDKADKDGKNTTFQTSSPTLNPTAFEAELEKALEPIKGTALGENAIAPKSFKAGPVHPTYPTQVKVTIDRPVPVADLEAQFKAAEGYWQIKPEGKDESKVEGKPEYRQFVLLTSITDPMTSRAQAERAFSALSLTAEVKRVLKDELAPPGIEVRSKTEGQTTLAVNLTSPLDLGKVNDKLAVWNIDATATLETEAASGGAAQTLLLTVPTAKADDLASRISADTETFHLSDPIPSVAKVGPAVAKELLTWAIIGVVAAWLSIIVYVWLRFEKIKYGIAGVASLVHDVLITMGFMAVMGRKFNLTVIAALLTIIGYSINDTIVIFDRIRENRRKERKRDVDHDLIDNAVNQTLSRTVITSLVTFLAVISLLIFGGGVIQDFALAMSFGIITGTYSSIFIAAPILILREEPQDKRAARAAARAATA
jgi:protein-export membrane protein SecD/preprotein translocase SecF subunit